MLGAALPQFFLVKLKWPQKGVESKEDPDEKERSYVTWDGAERRESVSWITRQMTDSWKVDRA